MNKRTVGKITKAVRHNLDPGVFLDPRFLELSGAEASSALLLLYLMSGPLVQVARIPGLISGGVGALADHLKWEYQRVQVLLAELVEAGWIAVDLQRNLIWVPHVAMVNPPDNPSVIQGWASAWNDLVDSPLRHQIWNDLYPVIKSLGESRLAAFKEVFESVTRDCEIHGVQHPGGTPWGDTVGGHGVLASTSAGWFPPPVNRVIADNCLKYLNGELIAARDLLRGEAPSAPAVFFRLEVSVRCLSSSERSEEDTQDLKGKATPRKKVPASSAPISPSPDKSRVVPGSPRYTPASPRPIPGSPEVIPVSPGVPPSQDSHLSTAPEVGGDSEGDDEDFEPVSACFEGSPYRQLYIRWNSLADIPGSQVHRIVAAQVAKLDDDVSKKLETDPDFITTAEKLIDGIAAHRWFLGLTANSDGSLFRMHFRALLNNPDMVHTKLVQHRQEQKRKEKARRASKDGKRRSGPTPVSKFEPESAKTENDQPNGVTTNPYFD